MERLAGLNFAYLEGDFILQYREGTHVQKGYQNSTGNASYANLNYLCSIADIISECYINKQQQNYLYVAP